MASLYIIANSQHAGWSSISNRLGDIRKSCRPSFSADGAKVLLQLKGSDKPEKTLWLRDLATSRTGILWSGTVEELRTQTVAPTSEWDTPEENPPRE